MELSDDAFEAEREPRELELFEQAEEAMEEAIEASPELRQYRENLMVERTPEGLRVQILDQDRSPMFPLGSDRMYPHMRKLLTVVVEAIRDLPNRVSIRGHTDALPFAADAGYDNWRLSSDRANVTRRAMVELGLQPGRVADVTGKGDSENLIADDAKDPCNRRISRCSCISPLPSRTRCVPPQWQGQRRPCIRRPAWRLTDASPGCPGLRHRPE